MNELAIVIPYFKIDYFEECIKSLSNQSNKRFSVYIGNDLSPDDPLPLIEKYLSSDQYFYFNYSDNLGGKNLAFQWMRILTEVKEPWFQILGDDDSISSNFVEEFYKNLAFIDSCCHVLKFNTVLDFVGDKEVRFYNGFRTGYYDTYNLILRKIAGGLNSSLSEHVFRRERFNDVGFEIYPLAWHTDDFLILSMSGFNKIYFISDSSVIVRVFRNSTSGSEKNHVEKSAATKKYLKDFAQLLIHSNRGVQDKRDFLIAIRKYKSEVGLAYISEIYSLFGLLGTVYFRLYSIGLSLKIK
ncbi:glycosyltransferase family A protein [Sphingobacterium sp.]|uniref:glycosyltransferase family A protein n=1 Tax=Sphingobacterium sp. TaxID=341027 RepID=UPI0028A7D9F9|nr:glycosyltransferase family A protein [Sphingobacterium sp.]